jgi:hypothetical protein
VSLSRGDEVPHIFTRKPRPRPAEFSVTSAKRLLQQNRPIATLPQEFMSAMPAILLQNSLKGRSRSDSVMLTRIGGAGHDGAE